MIVNVGSVSSLFTTACSYFPACSSSENSPTTKPNWTFELFGNTKQTSNTLRTFEGEIPSKFCVSSGGSNRK